MITTNAMLHHVDCTPYEGMPLAARPDVTVPCGGFVWSDAKQGVPGRGELIARAASATEHDA